ncbi:MAG: flagellin [Desulfuromonadaceae bacterium]|nr:flagellin [Desulfuromonadaceae bacterium]MDD5104070.1 flagellin [Desulfuromonadaceae bacterium]
MRITANITSDNSLYNLQQGRARLDRLNELLGSQMNVNRPSDDPINARLLLDIGDKIRVGVQYSSNISKASTWQQMTDTALSGMSDTLQLTRQQISGITSGTSDLTVRSTVVAQLTALKQQMIDMGNTQLGDQFLFGGAMNTTAPFTNVVSPPAAATAYYTGDETAIQIEIGSNTTQQMNVTGNQILTGTGASTPYGTTNILKAFDDLISAVTTNNISQIQAGAQALEDGSQQIDNARSDVASRTLRLDSMAKLNENTQNTLETIYGNTQNVDVAKLAVKLTQQQTAFQASLSATSKVTQLSLLDYL